MNTTTASNGSPVSGLHAIRVLAHLKHIRLNARDASSLSTVNLDSPVELSRLARELGVQLEHILPTRSLVGRQRTKMSLNEITPCLVQLKDARWAVLAKANETSVLLQLGTDAVATVVSLDDFHERWNGIALSLFKPDTSSRSSTGFGLRWILEAAKPHRHILFEVLVASAVVQVLALLSPLFFQVVIDKVLVHQVSSTLQVIVIGLVLVSVFEVALSGLRSWLLAHTANRMDVALGATLYSRLFRLPLAYFEARRVGDVVARVRELDSLRSFVTSSALTLVLDLPFAAIVFAVMYAYSPLLTAIVALSIPVYLLVSAISAVVLKNQLEQRFRLGAANQSFLVESVSGVATMKSMALETSMQRRWEKQLADYIQASFKATTTSTLASQSAQLIQKLTSAAIIWLGAGLVIDSALTVGELIAFNLFAGRISAPMLRLFMLWQEFQQTRVALARLGDIMDATPEPEGARMVADAFHGSIRFEHVKFRYHPDRAYALDGLSLDIKPGQVVGIVGASGSGKSTIARLIQRLSLPESGRILVDGMDVRVVDPQWLRSRIGVVPQETFLFNATVRDNIALGDPTIHIERVIDAAKTAGAHEFISTLPDAYDTVLGEHAYMLSGGQRQRLSIARALIRNPSVLVFDEATSALDVESEQSVHRNLQDICADRTVIFITHRLATIANADHVVILENGRVAEQGNPSELAHAGGTYARMLALQKGMRAAA